ncbi:MAG: hypothetical protein V1689_07990 [Pseudomonadota bacterium]
MAEIVVVLAIVGAAVAVSSRWIYRRVRGKAKDCCCGDYSPSPCCSGNTASGGGSCCQAGR